MTWQLPQNADQQPRVCSGRGGCCSGRGSARVSSEPLRHSSPINDAAEHDQGRCSPRVGGVQHNARVPQQGVSTARWGLLSRVMWMVFLPAGHAVQAHWRWYWILLCRIHLNPVRVNPAPFWQIQHNALGLACEAAMG
jgi:hypothetical protein